MVYLKGSPPLKRPRLTPEERTEELRRQLVAALAKLEEDKEASWQGTWEERYQKIRKELETAVEQLERSKEEIGQRTCENTELQNELNDLRRRKRLEKEAKNFFESKYCDSVTAHQNYRSEAKKQLKEALAEADRLKEGLEKSEAREVEARRELTEEKLEHEKTSIELWDTQMALKRAKAILNDQYNNTATTQQTHT